MSSPSCLIIGMSQFEKVVTVQSGDGAELIPLISLCFVFLMEWDNILAIRMCCSFSLMLMPINSQSRIKYNQGDDVLVL